MEVRTSLLKEIGYLNRMPAPYRLAALRGIIHLSSSSKLARVGHPELKAQIVMAKQFYRRLRLQNLSKDETVSHIKSMREFFEKYPNPYPEEEETLEGKRNRHVYELVYWTIAFWLSVLDVKVPEDFTEIYATYINCCSWSMALFEGAIERDYFFVLLDRRLFYKLKKTRRLYENYT